MRRKDFLKTASLLLSYPFFSSCKQLSEKTFSFKKGRVRITTRIYELHLRQTWTLSRGSWSTRRNLLVRLEKDGVVGYGEAAPIARYHESAESNQALVEKALPFWKKTSGPTRNAGPNLTGYLLARMQPRRPWTWPFWTGLLKV